MITWNTVTIVNVHQNPMSVSVLTIFQHILLLFKTSAECHHLCDDLCDDINRIVYIVTSRYGGLTNLNCFVPFLDVSIECRLLRAGAQSITVKT